jgi:hypothetical protein
VRRGRPEVWPKNFLSKHKEIQLTDNSVKQFTENSLFLERIIALFLNISVKVTFYPVAMRSEA